MIDLLVGGPFHALADVRQLGGQRLALIERLGAHLAGVVDAHQPGNVAFALLVQAGFFFDHGRRGASGWPAEGQQSAQHGVDLLQQAICGGIVTFAGHGDLRVDWRQSVLHRGGADLIRISPGARG